MAYTWRSGYVRNVTVGSSGQARQLVLLGTLERCRRVVLEAMIDVRNSDSGVIDQWMRHGVLSLIQATTGNPPPAPELVRLGNYGTRDILYSRFDQLGNNNILVNSYIVPQAPDMIRIDVEVSRGDGELPTAIWWVWGLPNTSVAGVDAGFDRWWYRVLVEVV